MRLMYVHVHKLYSVAKVFSTSNNTTLHLSHAAMNKHDLDSPISLGKVWGCIGKIQFFSGAHYCLLLVVNPCMYSHPIKYMYIATCMYMCEMYIGHSPRL